MTDIHKLIGKKIIRTCPCKCAYGDDHSYSSTAVVLNEIDGWNMTITRQSVLATPHKLDRCWNDGNWVEWKSDPQCMVTGSKTPKSEPPKSRFECIIE